MTTQVPASKHGKIVGDYIAATGDTDILVQGSLTLNPSEPSVFIKSIGKRVFIAPVQVWIDEEGYACTPQPGPGIVTTRGVPIIASVSTDYDKDFFYTSTSNLRYNNMPAVYPSQKIWVNEGDIVDLNTAGQVDTSTPGVIVTKGEPGNPGAPGASAYQLAVDNGFVGAQADWLASLHGTPGAPGKSAYEVAVANGYVGNEASWLVSLHGTNGTNANDGAPGKSAYELAVANGYVGDQSTWLTSLHGANGESAYQLAVDNGFVGTQADWLTSLHGTNGTNGTNATDGKSAYQLAVDGGYVGTQASWLVSLHGANGESAYQLAVDNGFVGDQSSWLASLHGAPGTPAPANSIVKVNHGADATVARPVGAACVYWVGTVAPANGLADDIWNNPTGNV